MTDNELSVAKQQAKFGTRLYKELSCRSMIDSILAYQCAGYKDENKVWEQEQKSYHNYLQKYVDELGLERVLQLIKEQIDSIYCVLINVGEDNEGVSYNSIVYNDDIYRINLIKLGLITNERK